MAEIYKFFNAVETSPGVFDREYVASDFADFFGTVMSTGLIHTDHIPGMAVSVQAGTLNTIISTGKAIMDGYPYENTTPLTLAHSIPEPTMDRIDRIILRLDLRNAERSIRLRVIEGTPAINPAAPVLQRDNYIHEISLAQILVRANTVQLLPTDLTDERLNEELCGLSYSMLSIPTEQFQKQWDEFMAGIVDSGFASGEEFAAHKADYVAHPAWVIPTNGAGTTYAVSLPGVTAYQNGLGLVIQAHRDVDTEIFISVNGLANTVVRSNKGNVVKGWKAGGVYTVRYNGVSFILQGESEVEIGRQIIVPGTTNKPILLGIHDGTGYVEGSANLTPANIKSGVNIFGTVGTALVVQLTTSPVNGSDSGTKQWTHNGTIRRWGGDMTPVYRFTVSAPGIVKIQVQFRIESTSYPATVVIANSRVGVVDSYVATSTNFHGYQCHVHVQPGDVITVQANTYNSGWYSEGTYGAIIYQDNYTGVTMDGGMFSINY